MTDIPSQNNTVTHDPYASDLNQYVDNMLGSYMMLIALISVSLNSLVLITITFRKTPMSALDVYIWNLALCDLCHGLLAHPLVATSTFLHRWPLGHTACHIYSAVVFFLGTTSISLLAAISVTRYIKLCCSKGNIITKRLIVLSLLPIYSNGVIWSVGPLLGWGSYAPEPFGLTCSLDWLTLPWSYTVFIFTFCYCFPLLLIICCYSGIIISVRRATGNMTQIQSKMDQYITKMACLMGICFMLAWTPYAVVSLLYLRYASNQIPQAMVVAAPFFAKSSTCYNPVIYFLAVKRFRNDMYSVISNCLDKTQSESISNDGAQTFTFRTMNRSDVPSAMRQHAQIELQPLAITNQSDQMNCESSTTQVTIPDISIHANTSHTNQCIKSGSIIETKRQDITESAIESTEDSGTVCFMDNLHDASTQTEQQDRLSKHETLNKFICSNVIVDNQINKEEVFN